MESYVTVKVYSSDGTTLLSEFVVRAADFAESSREMAERAHANEIRDILLEQYGEV